LHREREKGSERVKEREGDRGRGGGCHEGVAVC